MGPTPGEGYLCMALRIFHQFDLAGFYYCNLSNAKEMHYTGRMYHLCFVLLGSKRNACQILSSFIFMKIKRSFTSPSAS